MTDAIAGYSNACLVPPHSLSADYANAYNNAAYFGGSFPPDLGMTANTGNPLEDCINQLGGAGGLSGGYGYNYAYQQEQNVTTAKYNERLAELEGKSEIGGPAFWGLAGGAAVGTGAGMLTGGFIAGLTNATIAVGLSAPFLIPVIVGGVVGLGTAALIFNSFRNRNAHEKMLEAVFDDTRDGIYDGRKNGQLMFGLEEHA